MRVIAWPATAIQRMSTMVRSRTGPGEPRSPSPESAGPASVVGLEIAIGSEPSRSRSRAQACEKSAPSRRARPEADGGGAAASLIVAAAMPQPVIQVSHLSKRFDAVTAVDDVSFAIEARATVGLLGGN